MSEEEKNRFIRHPYRTSFVILVVLALVCEGLLRLINPELVRFSYDFRQAYRYSSQWKVDFEPDTVANIRLRADDNSYYLNFLITVHPDGYRTWDRSVDHQLPPNTPITHAIGDSFTMGWGMSYAESYPARLENLSKGQTRVLNLGLNGYGTIGATEKSIQLWKKVPAEKVVYLFYYNDYEDDDIAMAYRNRPAAFHLLTPVWNWARQNIYLASLPYALRYHFIYQDFLNLSQFAGEAVDYTSELKPSEPAKLKPDPAFGKHSKEAFERYLAFIGEKGAEMTIIILGGKPASDDFYWYCKERGLDPHYFAVPKELMLKGEWHLNARGQEELAEYVHGILRHND